MEPQYDGNTTHHQPTEKDVEMVTVELQGLPTDADMNQIKQMYFKNQHVVKSEQKFNSITG